MDEKRAIDEALERAVLALGKESRLREACRYAVMAGGKRLRPLIVLMIGKSLSDLDLMPVALGVEFFHTASLIADDLPCMDDEEIRRGKKALHLAFGEDIAILASYTLIAAGYASLHENGEVWRAREPSRGPEIDRAIVYALETITRCAGLQGATHGQFLDLYPPDPSVKTILQAIEEKTITLFEISFVFGWLFGGGNWERLDEVRRAAYHFGMAFQIADDIQDVGQEKGINILRALSLEEAHEMFRREIGAFEEVAKGLQIWNPLFGKAVEDLQAVAGTILDAFE